MESHIFTVGTYVSLLAQCYVSAGISCCRVSVCLFVCHTPVLCKNS